VEETDAEGSFAVALLTWACAIERDCATHTPAELSSVKPVGQLSVGALEEVEETCDTLVAGITPITWVAAAAVIVPGPEKV
jgi:hypothetical protein